MARRAFATQDVRRKRAIISSTFHKLLVNLIAFHISIYCI